MKYILICTIIILTSCQKNSLKDFFDAPEVTLTSVVVPIQNAFFGDPREVSVFDSLMVINDASSKGCFSIIDMKNRKFIKKIGREGRGPNELSMPGNLFYSESDTSLYFMMLNPPKLVSYKFSDLLKDSIQYTEHLVFTSFKEQAPYKMCEIQHPKYQYIAAGKYTKGRYALYSHEGKLEATCGNIACSPDQIGLDNRVLSNVYQGQVKARNDGQKVAFLSSSAQLVEVVTIKDSQISFRKSVGSFPKIVVDGIRSHKDSESPFTFISFYVTQRYIYGLYSGRTFKEFNLLAGRCNTIFVYDWDLNPIKRLNIGTDVQTLYVTPDDKQLYSFGIIGEKMEMLCWNLEGKL